MVGQVSEDELDTDKERGARRRMQLTTAPQLLLLNIITIAWSSSITRKDFLGPSICKPRFNFFCYMCQMTTPRGLMEFLPIFLPIFLYPLLNTISYRYRATCMEELAGIHPLTFCLSIFDLAIVFCVQNGTFKTSVNFNKVRINVSLEIIDSN